MEAKERLLDALTALRDYEDRAAARAAEARSRARAIRSQFQELIQAKLRGEKAKCDVSSMLSVDQKASSDHSFEYERIWQDIYGALIALSAEPGSLDAAHRVRELMSDYRVIALEPPAGHGDQLGKAATGSITEEPFDRRSSMLNNMLKFDDAMNDFLDDSWMRHEEQARRQAETLAEARAVVESITS